MITVIESEPNAQIFILRSFKEKTSQEKIDAAEKQLFNFLSEGNQIEKDRINLVRIFAETELTQIWLVPPGASPPKTDNKNKHLINLSTVFDTVYN